MTPSLITALQRAEPALSRALDEIKGEYPKSQRQDHGSAMFADALAMVRVALAESGLASERATVAGSLTTESRLSVIGRGHDGRQHELEFDLNGALAPTTLAGALKLTGDAFMELPWARVEVKTVTKIEAITTLDILK